MKYYFGAKVCIIYDMTKFFLENIFIGFIVAWFTGKFPVASVQVVVYFIMLHLFLFKHPSAFYMAFNF